jgi:uncharacterized protein YkwD
MRRRIAGLAAALAGALFAVPAFAGPFEDEVLSELNRVRAHPQQFAAELRRAEIAQARFGDGAGPLAQEEPDAVEDAIGFLMRQAPLPPLQRDRRLAAAARSHVATQGPRGDVGHGAPGALGRRLQREGVWAGLAAEEISYGQSTPRDVVRQLVIDSRVPSRGHRRDLFGHAYQAAGVACGEHARWGSMCVIDVAGAIMRR